jgi:SAM-dependent methyltransferase
MTTAAEPRAPGQLRALDLARCLACGRRLGGEGVCPGCGRPYPEVDGIVQAIGPLRGRNRIAAEFYDGPGWVRFRPWERLFLAFQGPGQRAARRKVLRHLPKRPTARALEVGIGDGENVPLLPAGWEVFGVDVARNQLRACLGRFHETAGRLAWAEAEALPFEDGSFDVVFTVGGINYFRDPAQALAEMRRVARPGGTLLAADEVTDLYRYSLGHMLGFEGLDRWGLRLMGLPAEFVAMVYETPALVEPAACRVWPDHRRVPVWNRLGYCLVDVREG